MNDERKIEIFRARRSLNVLRNLTLEILNELRDEHENKLSLVGESLLEIEEFLKEKHNVDIDLAHLVKHFAFLDEFCHGQKRKRILDLSGSLDRALDK